VPLQVPQPVAWIAAGIKIDDAMAREVSSMTGLQVTFMSRPEDGDWQARASTVEEPAKGDLVRDFIANRYATTNGEGNAEFGDDAITRVINLAPRADDGAMAVLQGSLPAALEPLRAMEQRQALVMLLGIGAAALVAFMLARGIAEPVRSITAAVRRVGAGDYSPIPDSKRRDEIGDLTCRSAPCRQASPPACRG
jgi:HAMP domain-containing protein